jgi:hypothetical protein
MKNVSDRCDCGYRHGENFSGNCSKCQEVINVRGSKVRGVNKAAVQLRGVYGNLPENLPSRAVGATAKGVYNRAVEANASARAKTASKTGGRAGGPVPFPELGADQYLVHQPPAGKRISSSLLLPDKPSKVAVKEVQEVPASVPPAKVGDAGTSKSVAAPAAREISKGAAAKKPAAQKSKPLPTVLPPSAAVTPKDIFAVSDDDDFDKQPKLGKQKMAASSQFPLGFKPGVFAGSSTVVKAAAPPLSPSRSRTPPKARAPPLSRSRSRTPPKAKQFSDFPQGQDLSPDGTAAALAAATAANATSNRVDEVLGAEDNAGDFDATNASAVFAHTLGPAAAQQQLGPDQVHFDLGDASKNPMTAWWDVFLNGKLSGGFLARSLLCMATTDATLSAASKWKGATSMTQKKSDLAEMRQLFMDWTDDATVHEWVRAKLFHIVCTNPKTYGNLKVTLVFVNNSTCH